MDAGLSALSATGDADDHMGHHDHDHDLLTMDGGGTVDDHLRLITIHTKIKVCPVWESIDGQGKGIGEPTDPAQLSLALKTGEADGRRLKMLDENGRLNISILASTPDIDSQDEIVEVSAFASSSEEYNANPILTAYHDLKQPVGKAPSEMTKAGLMQRGFVSSARPDIQQLVLDGVLQFASIGFIPKVMEWDEDLDVLRHLDLTHLETALVPIPANLHTWVTVDDVRKWRDGNTRRKAPPEIPVERPEPEAKEIPTPPAEPDDGQELDAIVDNIAAVTARIGSSLAGIAGAVTGE